MVGGSPGQTVGDDGLEESGLAARLAPTPYLPILPRCLHLSDLLLFRGFRAGSVRLESWMGAGVLRGRWTGSKVSELLWSVSSGGSHAWGRSVRHCPALALCLSQSQPLQVIGKRAGGELCRQRALGCLLKSISSLLTFTECPHVLGTVLSALQTCIVFDK